MQSIVVGSMYVEVEEDNETVAGGFRTEVDVATDEVDGASVGTVAGDGPSLGTVAGDAASLGTVAGDSGVSVEVIDDDASEESEEDGAWQEIRPILRRCPMRELLLRLFLLINGTFLV